MSKLSAFLRRKTAAAALLALAAAGFMVWGGTLANGFLYDDDTFVVQNEAIRSLTPLIKFFSPGVSSNSEQMNGDVWRPLTTFSYALTYRFFGLSAPAYHFFNVALHVLNAFLFYLAALALLGRGRRGAGTAAFGAALLFLLHPAQSETVAWVSQRSNVLFLSFYLGSYLLYIRSFRCLRGGGERDGISLSHYGLSLALFALSLLSKEMAASLPAVVLLTAYIYEKRGARGSLLRALPYAALTLAFLWARSSALGHLAQTGYWAGGLAPQLLTMIKGFAYYVKIALAPYPLSVEYLFPVKRALDAELAAYLSLLGGLLLLAWKARDSRPLASLGLLVFFASLLPVANIVPIRTIINERFLYGALAGLALAAADLLAHALELNSGRLRKALLLGGALLALYAAVDAVRVRDWKDHWTFVRANLRTCPQSATLHYGLGRAYAARGEYEKAAREFELCLAIDPAYAEALSDLGRLSERDGRKAEAIARYRQSVQKRVDFFEGLHNLGLAYYKAGDYAAAVKTLEKAVAVKEAGGASAALLEAKTNLAAACAAAGDRERAVALTREVLREAPGLEKARNNLALFSGAPAPERAGAVALLKKFFCVEPVRRALEEGRAGRYARDGSAVRLLNDGSRGRPEFIFERTLAEGYHIRTRSAELSVAHSGAASRGLFVEEGALVYKDAYRDTDVLYVPSSHGVQELVLLKTPASPRALEYEYSSEPEITPAGEIVVAGLALSRPVVFDARGKAYPSSFWKTGPRRVRIEVPEGLSYPALIDPAWRPTTSMTYGAEAQSSALLPDGKVAYLGGMTTSNNYLRWVNVFDPVTETYSYPCYFSSDRNLYPSVSLKDGRVLSLRNLGSDIFNPFTRSCSVGPVLHVAPNTATLLADGKVLLAGNGMLEMYDPYANTASTVAVLGFNPRSALLLQNGKVLLTTGSYTNNGAGLYDPVSNTLTPTGGLNRARADYSAVELADGRVLLMGGTTAYYAPVADAEIYNPESGTWSTTGSMLSARFAFYASLLPDGKVLVSGGYGSNELGTAELYDPAAGTFSAVATSLSATRYYQSGALLPDGRVHSAGGSHGASELSSADLLIPSAGAWSAGNAMNDARQGHSATVLPDGKVLVAGGTDGNGTVYSTAQLYDPAAGTWSTANSMAAPRYAHSATLLPDGRVLVAGGTTDGATSISSAELYDYASGSWSSAGSMSAGRFSHSAVLLPDGRVLAAGGYNSGTTFNSSADIYDPRSGSWSSTGGMGEARSMFAASLLPDGKVLAAGGYNGGNLSTAELYDPSAGSWSTTASMLTPRDLHTLTPLYGGKLLAAGGYDGSAFSSTSEVYDPASGVWTSSAALAGGARGRHAAVALPDGRVMLTGGYNGASGLSSVELYDPGKGWSTSGAMTTARMYHAAVLLPNGKVLLTGGRYGDALGTGLSSAESASYTEYNYSGTLANGARPEIASVNGGSSFPVRISSGAYMTLSGSRFNGIGPGGSGHSQGGNFNSPKIYMKKLGGGNSSGMSDEGGLLNLSESLYSYDWSSSTVKALAPAGLPSGYYYLWAVSNGMPSDFKIVQVATSTLVTVPLRLMSASAVSSGTFKVYFSTYVDESADHVNSYRLSPSISLTGASRKDSYLSAEIKLYTPLVNNTTYTASAPGIASLYEGAVPISSSAFFSGVNPTPYFLDDFNRPSGVFTTDSPLAGGWDIASVASGNSVEISTMSYRGGYGLAAADLSTSGSDASAGRTLSPAAPSLYYRYYIYLPQSFYDAMGNGASQYLGSVTASANGRAVSSIAYKTASGAPQIQWEVYDSLGGYPGAYSDITTDRWHSVEIYAPAISANTTAYFWLDGKLAASINTNLSDAASWDTIWLGLGWGSSNTPSHTAYFDEARVSTAAFIGPADIPRPVSASAVDKNHFKIYFDQGVSPEDGRYGKSLNYWSAPYLASVSASPADSFRSVLVNTEDQYNNVYSTITLYETDPGWPNTVNYVGTNANLAFIEDFNRPDNALLKTELLAGPWDSSWLQAGTSLSLSTFSYRGAYALYANDASASSTDATLLKNFSPGLPKVYYRFYVYLSQAFFDAMNNGSQNVLAKIESSSNARYVDVMAYKDGSGVPRLMMETFDSLGAYSSAASGALAVGAWHCVEIHAPLAGTGTAQLWIDGASAGTLTKDFSDAGSWGQLQLGLGWTNYAGAAHSAWFDEVGVSSITQVGPINPAPTSASVYLVYQSSISAYALSNYMGADGYVIEASSAPDFTGVVHSTATDVEGYYTPTLAVTDLQPNTSYYLRAGALWAGTTSYGMPYFSVKATLALPPVWAGISELNYSSMSVTWTPRPPSPSTDTCEGYSVDYSLFSNFYSFYTYNVYDGAASTAVLTGLLPGTTYYARVRSLNWAAARGLDYASTQGFTAELDYWERVWSAPNASDFSPKWGDLDGDGRLDILLDGSGLKVLRNNGDDTFTQVWNSADIAMADLCDMDNDGDLDIVTDYPMVYRNNGDMTFTLAWTGTGLSGSGKGVTCGDFDNDGFQDFFNARNPPNVVFRNNRNMTFSAYWSDTSGLDGNWARAADFDSDGRLDLLVSSYYETKRLRLLRNTGNGFAEVWAPAETLLSDLGYNAIGDMDGDGRLDFVDMSYLNNYGRVFFQEEGVVFSSYPFYAKVASYGAELADFDNDGLMDIAQAISGTISQLIPSLVHKAAPGRTFYPVWKSSAIVGGQYQYGLVFGDYDDDGKLDILAAASNAIAPATYPTSVYKGKMPFVNPRPLAPGGLAVGLDYDYSDVLSTITFRWDPGNYDAGLSSWTLYYNVAAATAPMALSADGVRVVFPSSATAHRFLYTPVNATPLMGNYVRPAVKIWPGDSAPKHGLLLESASNASMLMNTTYYFRVQTIDGGLRRSTWSEEIVLPATPALKPGNSRLYDAGVSSLTITWDAVPGSPQELSCRGFEVRASTAADFSGTIFGGSSALFSVTRLAATGLSPNTTYYYKAGSYNWNRYVNFASPAPGCTLAYPVASASLAGVYMSSVTVNWPPRPASPPSDTAEGYVLQASTSPAFTGTVFSTYTYSLHGTTLTVSGLNQGATYYLRVGTLNWREMPNYMLAGSTCTLANTLPPDPVTDLAAYATPGTTQQILLTWTAPGNVLLGQPYYDVRYSTWGPITNDTDFSTAAPLSGAPLPALEGAGETMSLAGLVPGVTYYFAIKAVNRNGPSALDTSSPEPTAVPPSFLLRQSPLGSGAGLYYGRSVLGDIDGDGDLDLVASGYDGVYDRLLVYKNDGAGSFSLVQEPKGANAGVRNSSLALGDIDGDGDLDLAVLGGSPAADYVKFYKNDGSGAFTYYNQITTGLMDGDLEFADVDNDGDLDLGIAARGSAYKLIIYANNGAGSFSVLQEPLGANIGLWFGSIAFGDIDGDGDMDMAASGISSATRLLIYRNNGGAAPYALLQEPLGANVGLAYGSLKFADIDNDGDLDLLASGQDSSGNQRLLYLANSGGASPFSVTQELMGANVGLSSGTIAVGDIDNDGDLDLLVCGSSGTAFYCRFFRNDGGASPFVSAEDILGPAGGLANGSVVLGDLDKDGDLDAVVNGIDGAGAKALLSLNGQWSAKRANTSPGAPVSLGAELSGGKLRFKWSDGQDNESAGPNELYYAIRISTTGSLAGLAEGEEPAKAVVPGRYGSPLLGNYLRPRNIANTPPNMALLNTFTMGTSYYWQVKTIDSGLRASAWSAQNMFYTPKYVYPTAKDTAAGDTTTDTTISDIQAADTSGASPTSVVANDGWFSVYKGRAMYMKDFDTSTIVGLPPYTSCYMEVQYSADGNYAGSNYIQFSTAPPYANWINIVKPSASQQDITTQVDLLPYNIRTSTQVAALKVRFINGSPTNGGTSKLVSFDYIFVYAAVIDTTPPSALTTFSAARGAPQGTIDLAWTATGDDGDAGDITAGGYRIEYSTDPLHIFDDADVQVAFSTDVTAGSAQAYTLAGLEHGNTYYIRVFLSDELPNWSGLSNGATVYLPPPPDHPELFNVFGSSASVAYGKVGAAKYRVEASTSSLGVTDFRGTITSSETLTASALTLTGLYPNTTYYFRAGALWAPTTVYAYTVPAASSTLALQVRGPAIYAVFPTSVTVNWLPHDLAVSSTSCEGYVVEASTAADFSGVVYSSATYDPQVSTLTIVSLAPCKTFFVRVGAYNWGYLPSYLYAGSFSQGSYPPTWDSPESDAGYTLNRRFRMWFTVNACMAEDARITVSTSANYDAKISTSFVFSQDVSGWGGITAWDKDKVYFTPPRDLTPGTTVFYLKAATYDGSVWSPDSSDLKVLVRGDWAWTDPVLTPLESVVKAQHILELRGVVENVRAFRGFAPPAWTDSSLQARASMVRHIHINELRDSLSPVLDFIGYSYAWTDSPLTGMVPVRTAHITDLRGYAAQP